MPTNFIQDDSDDSGEENSDSYGTGPSDNQNTDVDVNTDGEGKLQANLASAVVDVLLTCTQLATKTRSTRAHAEKMKKKSLPAKSTSTQRQADRLRPESQLAARHRERNCPSVSHAPSTVQAPLPTRIRLQLPIHRPQLFLGPASALRVMPPIAQEACQPRAGTNRSERLRSTLETV